MPKKYRVIAKVLDSQGWRHVKHHVDNLLKYETYLKINYQNFAYWEVYPFLKNGVGQRIDYFTKEKRPPSKWI